MTWRRIGRMQTVLIVLLDLAAIPHLGLRALGRWRLRWFLIGFRNDQRPVCEPQRSGISPLSQAFVFPTFFKSRAALSTIRSERMCSTRMAVLHEQRALRLAFDNTHA